MAFIGRYIGKQVTPAPFRNDNIASSAITARNLSTDIKLSTFENDSGYATVTYVNTALTDKSPIANPTFTGTVTAPAYAGDGSQLTGIEGVTAATLMKYGAI